MVGRVSQEVVEALKTGGDARVSQEVVEALRTGGKARVSQEVLEALRTGGKARVSQLVIEILVPNIEVFMPIVYPCLAGQPGYSAKWTVQNFNVPTQKMASGAELDLGIAAQPLHSFELTYELLRDTYGPGSYEFMTMLAFFGQMGGNRGRCLFWNKDDNFVMSQAITTTDGVALQFPLIRTLQRNGYSFSENIGYADLTAPFVVYLDGNRQDASTYSVVQTQPGLQQLKFNATPGAGHAITVDMAYYYYCKLPDDVMTFEKFMNRLWTLKKITLQSCRFNT